LSSIFEAMLTTDNDYSSVERAFASSTGQDLWRVAGNPLVDPRVDETLSVVIASFNGHSTLPATLASLQRQCYRNFELVLVDDGSRTSLIELVSEVGLSVPVTVVRIIDNRGLSVARNVGVQCAEGNTVVFIDDDMLMPPTMTYSLALRQAHTIGCVFVGFREDVSGEIFFDPKARQPRINGDWRFQTTHDSDSGVFLAADQRAPRSERRTFTPVAETANFKKLGNGRVVGSWDLPGMVIGHSICSKKRDIITAGGFAEGRFHGWGVEDLAFGALMTARGHFIVPALEWVSFHLRHQGRKVSRADEWKEMQRNFERYLHYVQEPVGDQRFPYHRIRSVQAAGTRILGVLD
jgi:glycosyltransferase involved in cell wall biosynthesis